MNDTPTPKYVGRRVQTEDTNYHFGMTPEASASTTDEQLLAQIAKSIGQQSEGHAEGEYTTRTIRDEQGTMTIVFQGPAPDIPDAELAAAFRAWSKKQRWNTRHLKAMDDPDG